MSRVVGFSLKLEGSTTTINDIERVETALKGITDQINNVKKINVGVLKPLFEGQAQFKKALQETNKIIETQGKLLNNLGNSDNVDKSILDNMLATIKRLKSEIDILQKDLNNLKSPTIAVPAPDGLDKLADRAKQVTQDIKDIAPAFESLAQGASLKFLNQIAEIDIRLKTVKENINKTKASTSDTKSGDLSLLLAEERALALQKRELTKEIKEQEKAFIANSKAVDPTSIIGLRTELSKLKTEYLKLGQEARESSEGLEKLNKIASLNTSISSLEQSTGDFRRNVGNYRDAVSGLIPTLGRLQEAGFLANKELLKSFQAEQKAKIDILTKEVNELAFAYTKMSAEAKKSADGIKVFNQLEAKLKELGSVADSTTNKFGAFRQKTLGIADIVTGGLIGGGLVATFQTVFQGVKSAIDISKELSDVEADVRKTTGLTLEQVKQLEEGFKNIDTRTSTTNLLRISAVAGQLGIEGVKGIEDFTKALDVVSVALGDDLGGDVEKVANDLSRLSNVLFGSTTNGTQLAENISFIGNALNELAANSSATGEKIVEFAGRIGRSLIPLGASADQVLALSATFDELNILPEQGATAINNLIKDIGANTKLISDVLKINKQELETAFNTNPLEAFDIVLKRITELSGGDQTKLLGYLKDIKQTGEGVSTVFLQLGKNADIFDRNLSIASQGLRSTSSLFAEFGAKNNNLAGSFDKLTKKLQDIASNPAFVKAFELIATGLGNIAAIIGDSLGAFAGLFERLTSNVGQTGKRVEGSLLGIRLENLKLSESNFTLLKGVADLTSFVQKEEISLKNTIKTLQDENISRNTKKKLIDDLLAKYPGLVNQYELEVASNERLLEIQTQLTQVLRRETYERIKLKTREALETQLINEEIRIAELELGKGLTGTQEALISIFGRRAEVLAEAKKQSLANLSEIKTRIGELEQVFDKAGKNIQVNELGKGVEVTFLKVRDTLVGLTNQIESSLESTDIGKRIKDQIFELSKASISQLNSLPQNASQDQLNAAYKNAENLIKQYEAAIVSSGEKIKGAIKGQTNDDLKSKEASAKKLEDYINKINELKRRLEDLRIDSIDNEFDKRVEKVKQTTKIEIEETKIKYEKQAELAKELIAKLGEAETKEIARINDERNRELENAKNELIKLKKEIDQILKETTQINIETNISGLSFDLSQEKRQIEIEYNLNFDNLKKQLQEGVISQKEFEEQSKQLDLDRLESQLDVTTKYEQAARQMYTELYNAQVKLNEAKRDEEILNVRLEADAKRRALQEDVRTGKVDPQTGFSGAIAIAQEENAKLLKIDANHKNGLQKLNQERVKNEQETSDQIVAINKNIDEKNFEKSQSAIDRWKLSWEEALSAVTELSQNASDSIFQINSNRQDKEYNDTLNYLEKEKEARLRLVKGNTAEEERITREFDAKKKQLDQQNFESQKRQAILQATIQGALAAIAVFTVPDFTFGIKSAIQLALITANTLAQIAVIKSQNFAEGGFGRKFIRQSGEGGYTGGSQAPADHTGKRPVGVAVFHENEYTATEEQVRDNKELFDALEQDRINRKIGKGASLSQYLKRMALSAVEKRESEPGLLAKRKPRDFPVLYQASYFQKGHNTSIEIGEELIERLANTIADRTEKAISKGVGKGYAEAVKRITKDEVRKVNKELKKAI